MTGKATLTSDAVKVILEAVAREVNESGYWDEIQTLTLADLCRANQDALLDDLHEDHPGDRRFRDGMAAEIRTYDELLGTSRASEIPKGENAA